MKKIFLFLIALFTTIPVFSQEDLSAILDSVSPREKISATFKSTRVINVQSNETVHRRTLDFRIGHRFGAVGEGSGGSIHNLYGLDNSSDIRIAFEYGITDEITVGFSRCKHNENYEALAKYRLIQQTNDDHIPLAITLFGNIIYSGKENPNLSYDNPGTATENLRKMSYTFQAILARKFSSKFSFELLPTMVHRNFVENTDDDNNLFAIGAAGRMKITRSTAFIADYIYNFSSLRKINNDNGYYNALGIGMEFETGGHVFSIMFTNAEYIPEHEFIAETKSSWAKGGFRFSFNISRNFKV